MSKTELPEYPFHPVAELFPMMLRADLDALKADISENGLREPIWLFNGAIIDGRNRYKVCRELGRPAEVRHWEGTDQELVAFVVSLNLKRRHLDESQRAMVASRLATMAANRPKNRETKVGKFADLSQPQAADILNVGERSIRNARVVISKGSESLVEAVDAGKVSVSAAAEVARLPRKEQEEVVSQGTTAIVRRAAESRAERVEVKRRGAVEQVVDQDEAEIEACNLLIKFSKTTSDLRLFLNSLEIDQIKSLHQLLKPADRRDAVRELKGFAKTLSRWIAILESRHA